MGTAKCSKLCPGGNCWVEKPGYAFKPAYMTRDNSIFCYAVHAVKKGTGITGEKDLAILSAQLKKNVGLFSCNDWEVFRDHHYKSRPRQRRVWQVLQERQAGSLHQHAPVL